MPLPNEEKLIALSEEILKQLEAMFGPHPGFRPVHAKGILLTGTFTPSSAAASLTRAQHAVQGSTPVTVRFSDSTGVPGVFAGRDAERSSEGTGVCGESSQGAGICAGDYPASGELCEGEVLWAYCDEVHQYGWREPVRAVHDCSRGGGRASGCCDG